MYMHVVATIPWDHLLQAVLLLSKYVGASMLTHGTWGTFLKHHVRATNHIRVSTVEQKDHPPGSRHCVQVHNVSMVELTV